MSCRNNQGEEQKKTRGGIGHIWDLVLKTPEKGQELKKTKQGATRKEEQGGRNRLSYEKKKTTILGWGKEP